MRLTGAVFFDVEASSPWPASRWLRLTGAPEFRRVFVHKPGIPQYRPGHARRLARLDELLSKEPRLAGLRLAGWSYRGIALNDAARASDRAERA